MEKLKEDLKKQIIETLDLEEVEPEDIQDDQPLFEGGLSLDSVDALELVVMIDKHYSIKITEMEVGQKAFSSINSLAQFIKENQ